MTQWLKLLRGSGLVGLLLIVTSFASAGGQNPSGAVVTSSEGYVDVKFSGKEQFVPLVEGTGLNSGDVIQTDSEARVVLMLPDKSTLVIGEDSRVVIKELGVVEVTKVSTSVFELLKGKVRAIVTPFVTNESSFIIRTNNVTVGVRGTDFGATYDPDTDETYILGLESCVSLTLNHISGSGSISVCAGNEIRIVGALTPGNPLEASDKTIDGFLKEMIPTEGAGTGERMNPPYIKDVFINRVVNLEDVEGTLTLTRDDLSIDRKVVVSGGATDDTYKVTEVEVSLDRGTSWNKASGTSSWTYEFLPQENTEYELMVRATNERGAVSDPWELGSWIIVFENTDYESISRSMIDKLFSAIKTGDSSADDLISDFYDGAIDNIYSKSEVVDKITNTFSEHPNFTVSYTINQISSAGDTIIATIRWSETEAGKKKEGTTKFWLAKYDGFRFVHSEGEWFLGSARPPELTLEVVSNTYGPPCGNSLRIILVAPDVPSNVNTITVYPITTCESTHFAILTRAFYEGLTGASDGFGGDFHYEVTTACTASGFCSAPLPFLYSSINPLVTVNFKEYGYDLSAGTMLP